MKIKPKGKKPQKPARTGLGCVTFVSCVFDDLIDQFLLVVRPFHLTETTKIPVNLHPSMCGAQVGGLRDLTWCSAGPSFCKGDQSCSSAGPADPATGTSSGSRSTTEEQLYLGATDQRQQLVDGHGPLLRLQVRHVILNHLVCDAMRKLLTQFFDPAKHTPWLDRKCDEQELG